MLSNALLLAEEAPAVEERPVGAAVADHALLLAAAEHDAEQLAVHGADLGVGHMMPLEKKNTITHDSV